MDKTKMEGRRPEHHPLLAWSEPAVPAAGMAAVLPDIPPEPEPAVPVHNPAELVHNLSLIHI